MLDKKIPTGVATGGLHDLPARTSILNILILMAARKKAAEEIRFMHGAWRAVTRPDLNADPAIQEHDRFWLRIQSDKIDLVGVFAPEAGDADRRHALGVIFADGEQGGHVMRSEAGVIHHFSRLLALVHDCRLKHAPSLSDEAGQ